MDNPYQPPVSQEPPPLLEAVAGLKDPRVLALTSLGCYGLATLGDVMMHVHRTIFAPAALLDQHDTYYVVGSNSKMELEMLIGIIGLLSLLLFFFWKYRAASNARVLDPAVMKMSPAMAVGCYFIPFAQIFLPYKAMLGIARASTGSGAGAAAWWTAHLCSILLGIVLAYLAPASGAITRPTALDHLYMAWDLVTYFFTWQIMMRITRAQSMLCSKQDHGTGSG